MTAPTPKNEQERRASLASYAILDTDPEPSFDDLTLLASFICKTPIALITLVDEHRQWFKSRVGMSKEETSRDIAFCSHAILQDEMFIVPDALKDERFRDNPLVGGEPHIRFYAGLPLINDEGYALGTLCVIDKTPRNLSPAETEALRALGRLVLGQMDLRRNLLSLKRALNNRTAEEHERQRELAKVQGQLIRMVGLETPTE
jgi:GAF domain-containing protein